MGMTQNTTAAEVNIFFLEFKCGHGIESTIQYLFVSFFNAIICLLAATLSMNIALHRGMGSPKSIQPLPFPLAGKHSIRSPVEISPVYLQISHSSYSVTLGAEKTSC